MPSFVCVVDGAYFNQHLYHSGDRIVVDDNELIERMGDRFVLEEDYNNKYRSVVQNLDRKKDVYTKAEVTDTLKETVSENLRLKNELKSLRKQVKPKENKQV